MSYYTDPTSSRRVALWVGVGAAAGIVIGLVCFLMLRGGDGAKAAGRPATSTDSGQRSAAIDRLTDQFAARADEPIVVTVGSKEARVDPSEAGLSVDVPATVDQALSAGVAVDRISATSARPVVEADSVALESAVGKLTKTFDRKKIEGTVFFKGTRPVAVKPRTGVAVEVDAAAAAIKAAYLTSSAPVQLPVTEDKPVVTADEVERAMTEVAEPAAASGVTVTDGDKAAQVSPAALVKTLTFTPDDAGRLAVRVDGAAIKRDVDSALTTAAQQPTSAGFKIDGGKPVVVPGRVGRSIDPAALGRSVEGVLGQSGARSIAVTRVDEQPALSTEDAEKLGIKERISTFTQPFKNTEYRVNNIGRAAQSINGTLLKPGDTYSQNRTLGERTAANGYMKGYIIDDGRYGYEYGGGVSTATTALWDNAFYAGLQRIEQRGHTVYISNYKAGLEATVSWGTLDLKFRNDTDTGVFITAGVTKGKKGNRPEITISMWGTKHWDVSADPKPVRPLDADKVQGRYNIVKFPVVYDTRKRKPGELACEKHEGVDGFDIDITRVFRRPGSDTVVKSEKLTTHYVPTKEIHCGPKPD